MNLAASIDGEFGVEKNSGWCCWGEGVTQVRPSSSRWFQWIAFSIALKLIEIPEDWW